MRNKRSLIVYHPSPSIIYRSSWMVEKCHAPLIIYMALSQGRCFQVWQD